MNALRRQPLPLSAGVLGLVVAAFTLFANTGSALAHPLGNFTINRYARVEVYSDAIQLHYVVDMAEIPAFQALDGIDTDKDGTTSPEELAAYGKTSAANYAKNFTLVVDGKAQAVNAIETSVQRLPGQGGLDTMRIVVVYAAPTAKGSQASVTFEDRNFNDRVGWKEIVVRPSEGAQITIDPALLVEHSNALLEYPAETLKSAPDMRSATFSFVPGSGAKAPESASVQTATSGRASTGFAALINKDTSSFWVIVFSLAAAFGFGMIHALGPGHGKTVVAAYLVGSKGTVRHAVALGATVTATHTSTVYIVGFIALAASSQFATEKVQLYIGVAAGLMIIAMGLSLFANRALRYFRPVADDGFHKHGIFGTQHSHMPGPSALAQGGGAAEESTNRQIHSHALGVVPVLRNAVMQPDGAVTLARAALTPSPSPDSFVAGEGSQASDMVREQWNKHEHAHESVHDHATAHGEEHAGVTWKSLVTLGIAGGLLPCPSAIVVMISAIALGKVFFGMLLIVAFSLGLAGVLTAIGIGLVLGKRVSRGSRLHRAVQRPGFARIAAALPAVSALAVTLAGIGVTFIAINQAKIL